MRILQTARAKAEGCCRSYSTAALGAGSAGVSRAGEPCLSVRSHLPLTALAQEGKARIFEDRPESKTGGGSATASIAVGEHQPPHDGPVEGGAAKRARRADEFCFPDGSGPGMVLSDSWSAEEEALKAGLPNDFVLSDFGFDKCQTLVLRVRRSIV